MADTEDYKTILTTDDISNCLAQNGKLTFRNNESDIRLTYIYAANTSSEAEKEASDCAISTHARPGQVIMVLVLEQSCIEDTIFVTVGHAYWDGCEKWVAPGLDYVSEDGHATVTITVEDWSIPFTVRLVIRSVPAQPAEQNQLLFASDVTGYTQSPGFDPDMGGHPTKTEMDSWTEVTVPSGHVAMLSVAYVLMPLLPGTGDLGKDHFLSVHAGSAKQEVWHIYRDTEGIPRPSLLRTNVFHVHYKRGALRGNNPWYYMFRILFTFHEEITSAPQQLPSGLWNCSSPTYPSFQLHLLCNLEADCDRDQDEASGCSHTPCAHSGVTVAGGCYFLSPTGAAAASWNDANAWCAERGARLASLNTEEKMEAVGSQLRLARFQGAASQYLGLSGSGSRLPIMYKYITQWQDSTLNYNAEYTISSNKHALCGRAKYSRQGHLDIELKECAYRPKTWSYYLCQARRTGSGGGGGSRGGRDPAKQGTQPTTTGKGGNPAKQRTQLVTPSSAAFRNRSSHQPDWYVQCSTGRRRRRHRHVTHRFLACDVLAACVSADGVRFSDSREAWDLPRPSSAGSCIEDGTSLPPSFACASGGERVPYTLVCDYRRDCLDDSDEGFCAFPTCDVSRQFRCRSQQCVDLSEQCDGFVHCLDQTDEERCGKDFFLMRGISEPPPALVTLDGTGGFSMRRILRFWRTPCPDSHFWCQSVAYCMPVYVRCNGVNDCPEKEDEGDESCGDDDAWACAGLYRCRGFLNTCLHPDHLCDGWPQCPQHDDERFCRLTCPEQCACLGYSWFCSNVFLAHLYTQIRYLDAGSSGLKPSSVSRNTLLIHLSLSKCDVVGFRSLTLPNLHSLDLHCNRIRVVANADLEGLPSLGTLFLSGNPVTSLFAVRQEGNRLSRSLIRLDLSSVRMATFNSSVLASFPNLQTLNLSGCGIESLESAAFRFVPKLRVLDARGCPLASFPARLLKPLASLRAVSADTFKACCPATLPDGFSDECRSPDDPVASCDNLLKSSLHRALWHSAASLALLGNLAMTFKRLRLNNNSNDRRSGLRRQSAVDAFVTSIFACGCIHAAYSAVISAADLTHSGNYAQRDADWRQGTACAVAGFLWLLSTELSLFLACLATLDRVLVSWGSSSSCPGWRFSAKSTVAALSVALIGSATVASIPLYSSWKLFQQTALCSPLFLAGQEFPGRPFLFGVFSVFNLTLSWFAAFGQLSVSVHLRRNRFAFVQNPRRSQQLSVSRRVMALVSCDVLHCFVVGHAGLIVAAVETTPGSDVVFAFLARVLATMFSWALKPAVHVAVTLLEHRRREREERMLKMLIAQKARL